MPRVRTSGSKPCVLSTERSFVTVGMSSPDQVPRAVSGAGTPHARRCAQHRGTATGHHSPPKRTSLALHSVATVSSNSDHLCFKKNAWLTYMHVGWWNFQVLNLEVDLSMCEVSFPGQGRSRISHWAPISGPSTHWPPPADSGDTFYYQSSATRDGAKYL